MSKNKKDNSPKRNDPPKRNDSPKPTTPFQQVVNAASQKDQPAKQNTIKLGGKTVNVNFGNKLNVAELEKLQAKTGLTPDSIISKLQDRVQGGIKVASGARTFAQNFGNTTTTNNDSNTNNTSNTNQDDNTILFNGQKYTPDQLNTLFQNIGDANVDIQRAENEGDLNVANAYANAQSKVAEFGLEGTKYSADKEAEWRQKVADIEVKGKLDLQPIINAGLERVADIEGQSARDVAKTTGEYSLKSMETRTEADKSLGKMQLAGSMYGLLSSAFG
jgi:hypothetical protein